LVCMGDREVHRLLINADGFAGSGLRRLTQTLSDGVST
jgi:hypothetical protein